MASSAAGAAAITTYSDRAAFESALASLTLDTLAGLARGSSSGITHRPGYSIVSAAQYGCTMEADCADNTAAGISYADGTPYLWSYRGDDTFTFSTAVNGFGFDFADPPAFYSGGFATIDGLPATATSGFFGLITSEAKDSFSVGQTGSYMVLDNVTFGLSGVPAEVPEPALPALLSAGLLSLALSRRAARR